MEKYQSHRFGDLLRQHFSRRKGLSQNRLADAIDVDPAVISDMSHGRRLTGPTSRQRVLDIIRWLHAQDVLHSEEEATALLEAAGMAKLLPNELRIVLRSADTPAASDSSGQSVSHNLPLSRNQRKTWRTIGIIALRVTLMGIVAFVWVWTTTSVRPATVWQEEFNPIEKRWTRISAKWEDVAGPTAILHETNPDADYGKVESEIITVDVDSYPILRVNVVAIDPGASYTVQVLTKPTNTPIDVIRSISSPGVQTANLAQQMDWHGVRSFTINIWIGGEGKSATFKAVSIGHK